VRKTVDERSQSDLSNSQPTENVTQFVPRRRAEPPRQAPPGADGRGQDVTGPTDDDPGPSAA